ncbi:MAG TPA: sulfurtransferase, partial [Polyangiaceae bacterium]
PTHPGRHPLPPPDVFVAFLARIGVGPDDVVVAYDDTGGSTAARLWWLLKYFGHDGGRVLDGGLPAWTGAGHPLDTADSARKAASKMNLVPRRAMVVDKEFVREFASRSNAVLLDARASERFEGAVESVDARPGHIPGAKSAPFVGNLQAPGGRFLSSDELAERYAALGITDETPVVAYCGSGVTACHDLLALTLAGQNNALLYEGSWSEWARDDSLPAGLGKG